MSGSVFASSLLFKSFDMFKWNDVVTCGLNPLRNETTLSARLRNTAETTKQAVEAEKQRGGRLTRGGCGALGSIYFIAAPRADVQNALTIISPITCAHMSLKTL